MQTKIMVGLVILLALTSGGYFLIQQIQDSGKTELEIETLRDQIETRERIDDAVRNSPTTSDDSRSVLRDFLDSRD